MVTTTIFTCTRPKRTLHSIDQTEDQRALVKIKQCGAIVSQSRQIDLVQMMQTRLERSCQTKPEQEGFELNPLTRGPPLGLIDSAYWIEWAKWDRAPKTLLSNYDSLKNQKPQRVL